MNNVALEQMSLQDYLTWLNREKQLIVNDVEFWQRQGITTATELGEHLAIEQARAFLEHHEGGAV